MLLGPEDYSICGTGAIQDWCEDRDFGLNPVCRIGARLPLPVVGTPAVPGV
jgi:hypothetical protein